MSTPFFNFFQIFRLLSHQAHTENGNSQRRQVSHGKQVPGNDLIPIGNGYTAQKDDPRDSPALLLGFFSAQTPTGGSSGEYWAMGASLTQQRRVKEEGFRVVNFFYEGRRK